MPSITVRRFVLALVAVTSVVGLLSFRGNSEASKLALFLPILSATKTATLNNDANGNGVVNPGDRLRYLVTINNGGDQTALGVALNDTIDANTTLFGTPIASAVAVNDSYGSIGNVGISVPDGAGDLLANDLDANNPSVPVLNIIFINATPFVSGNPVATTNGTLTVNSNGSFTYMPTAGFEGTDTFNYTLSNGTTLTDTATVSITVSGMIWFVDANAGVNGNGRLGTPFNSLANFNAGAADDIGDNIFLYESATSYLNNITLLNNQRLIGQDATAVLAGAGSITGITAPSFSNTLPAMNSGNGVLTTLTTTTAATNAVTPASGNTIRGLTIGNTTGAKLFATATVGTLTIGPASGTSDVTLNGNGQAMSLTGGGTLAARFASISSTNSAASGITLTSVGGSFVSPTTTITNPTTLGISVGSSPAGASFNFGNTTANQSGGTAVSLTSNAGAFTFADLDIAPDSGQRGLLASSNTGVITTTSGTLSTTNGTSVEITGVSAASLTPLNIQLTSVSVTGNQSGVRLINTSSSGSPGGFSVVGSGTTDGSGGVMNNMSGADGSTAAGIGVYMSNVTNVTLTNMSFTGTFGNWAVRGDNVNNFTFRDCIISGAFGSDIGLDEGGMRFGTQNATTGLKGTALFEGNTIGGGLEDNVTVYLMGSDTLNLTVRDNPTSTSPAIFNNNSTASGSDHILVESGGTSNLTVLIDGVDFNGARGDLIQTSAINATTQNITIQNNTFNNQHTNIVSGGGGLSIVGVGGASPGINSTYRIHNNTFKGTRATPIYSMWGGLAGTVRGVVTNNTIGTPNGVFDLSQPNRGSMEGMGFFGGIDSKHPGNGVLTYALRIENNTFRDINGAAGILLRSNSQDNLGTCRLEATIKNNTFAEMGPNVAGGIYTQLGGASINNDLGRMGLDIANNSINIGGAISADAIVLDQLSTISQFYLPGYAGPAAPTNQVSTFLTGKGNTWVLPASNSGTGGVYANSNAVFGTPFVLTVPAFASVDSMSAESNIALADLLAPSKLDMLSEHGIASTSENGMLIESSVMNSTAKVISNKNYLTTIKDFVARHIDNAGKTVDAIGSVISPTVYAQDKSSVAPESGENINKSLGSLPVGEIIRVQFDVTIDLNIPTNDFSVSNQGTISATGLPNVLTDDVAGGAVNPTVTGVVHPPTLSKAFGAPNIALNGTTSLTFTIGNANPATAFTNVAFSDTLPAGMVIATPNGLVNNCGGGTVTATQATGVFSVTGLSRAANSTCTIVINVLATTDGVKNNTTGTIASTQGGTGLTASASVTAIAAPSFTKSFGAATVALNGSTSLSFTVTNNSANSSLSGVGFTDALPAGLVVATPNGLSGSCGGGTITANQASGTVSLSGATIAASSNCTFSVNVTGTTAGVKNNSVQLSTTQLGTLAAPATASVNVIAPPSIAKSFNATGVIANNGFSTMTFAITNPIANTVALTGVTVTDSFPAGMEVDATPTATNSCSTGTFSPVAAATSVSLSGASIPVNTTCNFTVRVRGTTTGAKVNTTGNVTSTNGGTGNTGTATLTVSNSLTWNGVTSNAWTTATNWTPNVVPVSTNDVDIPASGVTNNPVISTAVSVNNITEALGRTLTINAASSLTAAGACTINGTMNVAGTFSCGTFAGTGTVAFTGAAAQNIPALAFNNLTISNATGTSLLGNTTVNGVLNLAGGNITTGANLLTVGPSGSITRSSGSIIGDVEKIFGAIGPFTYPVGTATGYSPVQVNVTVLAVTPSTLRVRATSGSVPVTVPALPANTLQRYWTLTGSGITANVTFNYLDGDIVGNELNYRTVRVSGTTYSAYGNTASCPTTGPQVCVVPGSNQIYVGGLSSFSDWTASELVPTAAAVNVKGRVLRADGRGVNGAQLTMTDLAGNVYHSRTNQFGYYGFYDVPAGQSYAVSVMHKQHSFKTRVISLGDNLDGLDFMEQSP